MSVLNAATPHVVPNEVPERPYQTYILWASFVAGLVWAVYLLFTSQGLATQDAVGHFVISREAWRRPGLLLHHWGRPVNTILYMIPALFGLFATRLMSLVFAVLTVLVTLRLARKLDVDATFLVPLLLWFQPWYADLSVHPALTEIPFTLSMVLTAYLFVSGRLALASLLIGLFPLLRIEAVVLTGLWIGVCLLRRNWWPALIAALPLVVYTALYRVVFGMLPDGDFPILPFWPFATHGPARVMESLRSWFLYPKLLVRGAGFPVVGLALYALPFLARSRPRLLVFAWYGAYLVLHVAAYKLGGGPLEGQPRYILPLAPAMSIAGAIGLGWLVRESSITLERLLNSRVKGPHIASVLLAVAVLVILVGGLQTKPRPRDAEGAAMQAAAAWLRGEGLDRGVVISTHVWLHYFLPGHFSPFRPERPEALWSAPPSPTVLPPGAIVVWDRHYSNGWGLPRAAFDSPEWEVLREFGGGTAIVVRKRAAP